MWLRWSPPQGMPRESSGAYMLTAVRIVILAVLSIHCHATESILDEIVVTATKHSQTICEVPSSISLLGEEDLGNINHTHINEALHRVAGVWISRGTAT